MKALPIKPYPPVISMRMSLVFQKRISEKRRDASVEAPVVRSGSSAMPRRVAPDEGKAKPKTLE
jgi:hypothetical protein